MDDHVVDEGSGGIEQGGVLRLADGQPRGVIDGHLLHGFERLRAVQADVSHVADVEESDGVADGQVLGDQSAGFAAALAGYSTGISHPLKSTMRAPSSRCAELRAVLRTTADSAFDDKVRTSRRENHAATGRPMEP